MKERLKDYVLYQIFLFFFFFPVGKAVPYHLLYRFMVKDVLSITVHIFLSQLNKFPGTMRLTSSKIHLP